MGLIYNPSESRDLVSNFKANLTTCQQVISDLKRGNRHLIGVLNSKQLGGSAFDAGLAMFSQLVIPTVDKVEASIQAIKTKLQQYSQYTGEAGGEILDEDKLNQELQELRSQQAMVTSQIRLFQNQARFSDAPDISAMCYDYARTLSNYVSTIQDDIQKVEEKLKKLYELDMKIACLFSETQDEIQSITTALLAINSVSVDSSGKFSMTCSKQDLDKINKFLSDKGKGGSKSKGKGKTKVPKGTIIPNPLDIIGKLFGVKNETTDTNGTKDFGGSYTKVTRTTKDSGVFNAIYKDGKFVGVSFDLGGVSIDARDWDLSVGLNTKLFGNGMGVNLGITKDGLDSSFSYSNGQNSYNYGVKDQWDLANGLLATYVKNKTVLVKEGDLESFVTVEAGDRFFNGGQAVKVGVIAGAGALFAVGVVSGRGDITEKAKELFQEGVGKFVESGA